MSDPYDGRQLAAFFYKSPALTKLHTLYKVKTDNVITYLHKESNERV